MENHEHIRRYYKNIGGNTLETSASNIKNIYLKNILTENDVMNKSVLEVGAGGSQFKEIFIEWGCDTYTGVELIASRIPVDSRLNVNYHNVAFEQFQSYNKYDIIFLSLTYMYIKDRISAQKKNSTFVEKGWEGYIFGAKHIYALYSL